MPSAKLLQLADLHLGAPFGWLPAAHRQSRRAEQRRALDAAITAAIERRADLILVAGDLFDREAVDASTLAFAVHAFDRAGCPPVFVSPGNHDPWSASSPCWSTRLLDARGFAWPPHVHVFGTADWSDRQVPGQPIRVWGRCFSSGAPSYTRPLDPNALVGVRAADGELAIAVFHGAREGHRPPNQTITAPFSDDEAQRSPFAYLAVGHYHRPSRLERQGSVRLAYSGSAVAIDATELGTHGALEVRIEFGDGPARVEVEPVPLDPRRVHEVTVDVTGATSSDQIDERIGAAFDHAGVERDDIVTARLQGRSVKGVRVGQPGEALEARVFRLRIDRGDVRPDYDLAAYRARPPATTEDRFVRALLERIDGTVDPAERATLESALYYGLDAFRLREVTPSYEELDA